MTALRRCVCCRQIIPPAMGAFDNCPIKRRIYEFIARHPEGVTRAQIMEHAYAIDPGGGPENQEIVNVHIWGMRKRLAAEGLAIANSRGPGAVYRLVPIEPIYTDSRRTKLTATWGM